MINEEELANFRRCNGDTEGNYRYFLKLLISRDKTNTDGGMAEKFLDECRVTAQLVFPKGAAAARKKDWASEGIISAFCSALSMRL